jgi:hypothetical protein
MEASKNSEIYYSRGPTAETNVSSEPSACQQIACGPRATGFLGCRKAFFDDFGFLAARIPSSLWCPRLAPVLSDANLGLIALNHWDRQAAL